MLVGTKGQHSKSPRLLANSQFLIWKLNHVKTPCVVFNTRLLGKHTVPFDPQHQSANVRCRTEDKARQGQEHHLDISTVTVGRMLRFKHI